MVQLMAIEEILFNIHLMVRVDKIFPTLLEVDMFIISDLVFNLV